VHAGRGRRHSAPSVATHRDPLSPRLMGNCGARWDNGTAIVQAGGGLRQRGAGRPALQRAERRGGAPLEDPGARGAGRTGALLCRSLPSPCGFSIDYKTERGEEERQRGALARCWPRSRGASSTPRGSGATRPGYSSVRGRAGGRCYSASTKNAQGWSKSVAKFFGL
jgi:hypothetical protein